MEIKQKYIKEVFDMETGGGCVVDFVKLSDGRIVGINDESIVLYEDMNHFTDGRTDMSFKDRCINIPCDKPKPQEKRLYLCHWFRPQYENVWEIKGMDFFHDDNGYDANDLATIEGLELDTADSDTWEAEDHTVRRIQ